MGEVDPNSVGKEPLPPGFTEDSREACMQTQNKTTTITLGHAWSVRAAVAGCSVSSICFARFIALIISRQSEVVRDQARAARQASVIYKDSGHLAMVSALYAGTGYVIERYRGKNDIYNSVSAGFIAGSILGLNTGQIAALRGPGAALRGGLVFAACGAALRLFETGEL
ncbi:hypothetical protein BDZ89DRAFT_1153675 [Hymenopellis radicata]|nr:hypothetical protein BDZ89DRAFT_1153675 [Hymenopellis radicata]